MVKFKHLAVSTAALISVVQGLEVIAGSKQQQKQYLEQNLPRLELPSQDDSEASIIGLANIRGIESDDSTELKTIDNKTKMQQGGGQPHGYYVPQTQQCNMNCNARIQCGYNGLDVCYSLNSLVAHVEIMQKHFAAIRNFFIDRVLCIQ